MTPDEFTNQEFHLDVGDGHRLYVQDWGKANAKTPILFLHGGPGGGFSDKYKTIFNPHKQRVIFFDQRGAGKSTPSGSLKNNTTSDLVEDTHKIVAHLQLKDFIVTGGSWGSCLALAYAIKYPNNIKAMVLKGIFTGSKVEVDWLDKGKFESIFPDVWERFLADTPKNHHNNPSSYHFKRILGKDPEAAKQSAYAYQNLEAALLSLDDRFTPMPYEDFEPDGAITEVHYLANNCFIPENYILDNAHKLTMPIWLIQGRYDMVCPPITAYELSKRIPNCELVWTVAGHANDRANYDVSRSLLLQMASD